MTLAIKAQEEMAWQIAKMIVNDVVHQSNHDSPGKATKVQNLAQYSLCCVLMCGEWLQFFSKCFLLSVCSYDPTEEPKDWHWPSQ